MVAGRQPGERLLDGGDQLIVGYAVFAGVNGLRDVERGDDLGEQDRIVQRQRGADGILTVGPGAGQLPGAAAGPFPETVATAQISLAGTAGTLKREVLLTGRASSVGPVDDLTIDAGRWARTTGEVVWSRGRTGLPLGLGQTITVTGVHGSSRLTVVGIATSVTNTSEAWVVPAEITALRDAGLAGPGFAQMLDPGG